MNSNASKTRVGRDIWTQFAGVVLIGLGVAGLMGWKTNPAWRPAQPAAFQRHVVCNTSRITSTSLVQAEVTRVQAEIARQQAEIVRRQVQRIAAQLRNQNPL